MKTRILAGVLGLAATLGLGLFNASADLEISAGVEIHSPDDFYAPLTENGAWIDVGSYGRCWHPAHVEVDWRPYCDGHWVWTDCGWYWVSDEPWAWACYHYGTWTLDVHHGWLWVPGIEWAPAWVYWRSGGGHIGWAPRPPHAVVVAPAAFVFVEEHRFHEHFRPSTVIVNNTTIINHTTEITQVKRETRSIDGGKPQKVVINEGPKLASVQQATGQKINTVAVREAVRQTPMPQTMAHRTTTTTTPVQPPGAAKPSPSAVAPPAPARQAPPVVTSQPPSERQTPPVVTTPAPVKPQPQPVTPLSPGQTDHPVRPQSQPPVAYRQPPPEAPPQNVVVAPPSAPPDQKQSPPKSRYSRPTHRNLHDRSRF